MRFLLKHGDCSIPNAEVAFQIEEEEIEYFAGTICGVQNELLPKCVIV